MPIISTIGRKQPKLRAVIVGLYLLLIAGAVTMVYPFLLMISLSFTSLVDQHEFRLIPRYWYDDAALFRKYEEAKYEENINYLNLCSQGEEAAFEKLQPPAHTNQAAVTDWQEFARTLPLDYQNLAHQGSISRITPEGQSKYRAFLRATFHDDVQAMGNAYGELHPDWSDPTITFPTDRWEERQTRRQPTRKYRDFEAFKRALAPRYRVPVSMDGVWTSWLTGRYDKDITALAARHGASYRSLRDLRLPARLPSQPKLAADWIDFVRHELPFHYLRLAPAAAPAYRESLRRRYGTLEELNRTHHAHYTDWAHVFPSPTVPEDDTWRLDWTDFVTAQAPPQVLSLVTPDTRYRDWLAKKYGTVAALNRCYGTRYASFAAVLAPRLESDYAELLANKGAIKHEFVVRNYREVLEYIVLHGRAVWNTLVLVLGMLLVTLIVNPLAAYALSRYQLPGTYKILLFLLATMAFPGEVTMIPGFLLLKQAHLLNTYWAMILPAMASGYSIFLLKGFFDSLPRELYEAAMLDGAREMTMFARITVPLSKPVLAVIALGTFGAAYGSFMWAFLVCQDPKMWTLMVWLFQLQTWAPQFMIMAALVLSALPTLLVFIFCQNIIMRGIILPVEK